MPDKTNDSVPACRLYLITPPKLEPTSFAETLAIALDAGDVGCVQLRLKDLDRGEIARAAEILAPVAQSRDVAFLMNDFPDIARETGCDGVHVGQEDASYEDARRIVGADCIVGVTCHASSHLAMEAADKGADYVAFGAFFATKTKDAKGNATPDILSAWSETTTVPCVAIGGITPANCGPLVKAGADFLAVVSAIWDHAAGPAAAVKEFNKVIADSLG